MSRFLALTIIFTTAAFATARFSGETGVRAHRIRLAAGRHHACAILDDGTVECWGANESGQLGNGLFTTRSTPVTVPLPGPAISLALGTSHSCAILSSTGAVRCWGLNDKGQLGDGQTFISASPVAVIGLTNIVSIAAGKIHTCAVRVDGTAWCWGSGVLGSAAINSLVPVQVTNLTGAVSVVAGEFHNCALLQDGAVKCWGSNQEGELGSGNLIPTQVPVTVRPLSTKPGVGAVDLAASVQGTCAQSSDGLLSCWGSNLEGELAIGIASNFSDVPRVYHSSLTVVAMAAGQVHRCAITVIGTVNCWGGDSEGQLGDGSRNDQLIPGPPVPGVANAVEIAAGDDFTCARISDGTIRCWGGNSDGQHGNGNQGPSGTDSVVGIAGTFLGRGAAGGGQFTCGRRGAGAAACWGAGLLGQLGNSASNSSPNPVAVTGLSSTTALSAGKGSHACALDARGTAQCWGGNGAGQLGNGTTTDSNRPVTAIKLPNVPPYVSISAGDGFTCGLTSDGQVVCWGANERGQIGNGGTANQLTPVLIGGVDNAVEISAGKNFVCALIVDSTVRCWGDNFAFQLGDGGAEGFSPVPKTVPGLSGIVGISAGAAHVCGVNGLGGVLCWGSNSRGQIGNNTTLPAGFPNTVSGLTDAVSVSAGGLFTCAVHAGGTASCWGGNDSGELGVKDSADHLTPTTVAASIFQLPTGGTTFTALSGIAGIATGRNHIASSLEYACAILASGVFKCWGDNSQGEIGDGTTINRARPTLVNSFAANVDAAATLRNGRVADVTALIDCDAGENAHIVLTLEQGLASGTGHADARCEGRLVAVPMTVPAQGPAGFAAGAATANVEAIGTHWTRQVVLSTSK